MTENKLRSAFTGIRQARQDAERPAPELVRTPAAAVKVGKSARPDYEAVKVYMRKDLRRRAIRRFEDAGGRDLSDLVEQLLQQYLGA